MDAFLNNLSPWILWLAGGALGALGLWLLFWAVLWDRITSRGKRRCPKCWYDMSGNAASMRCSECGYTAARETSLLHSRKRWRWAATAMLLVLAMPGLHAYRQFRLHGWYWLLPEYTCVEDVQVADCRIRRYVVRDPAAMSLDRIVIQNDSGVVFRAESHNLSLGSSDVFAYDRDPQSMIAPGQDINGDGNPDLVISEFTGGAHCCFGMTILQLAPEFRVLAAFPPDQCGGGLRDLDQDGDFEYVTCDSTFDYWHGPHAGSPFPQVVLEWRGGRHAISNKHMLKPAPSVSELLADAQSVRSATQKSGQPDSRLWGIMLDLIYTGHEGQAWAFLDIAWTGDTASKDTFAAQFLAQLSTSPYWPQIRAVSLPDKTIGEVHLGEAAADR